MITLRSETADDEAFLRKVHASTLGDYLAALPLNDTQKTHFLNLQFDLQRQHYRNHYPDAEFMVIHHGQQPIGRWYLHHGDDHLHLLDMSLLPEYRNQGIGSRLLLGLLALASADIKPVRLFVANGNPAYHLYSRHQFQVVDQQAVHSVLEWCPR